MDNNRRNPFANHTHIQHAFMSALRHIGVQARQHISNARAQSQPQSQPQADDFDDLPPLEPISVQATPQGTGDSGATSTDVPILSTNGDVDMPPGIDPAFASFEQPSRQDDDISMPELQSVSDSSDETSNDSVDEVEMMPALQPVEDDNDSSWVSDDEDDDLPPLEPIAGNRRARVEDDQDEDRDRRHPSQRMGNARNQQQRNAPPFFAGINPPRGAPPPGMIDLFQTFMGNAGPPAGTAPGANVNTGANTTNQDPGAPRPFFTVDVGDGVPRRWGGPDGNGGFEPPPGFLDIFFPEMTAEERADPLIQFQTLIERLGGAMGQAFGFPFEEEKEDPERAKRLVAGLEEVPVGLVRRMEKVGGAPGGHVDDSTGEVEVPGCAICWDTLLDSEGEGFKANEDASAHSEGATNSTAPAADNAPTDVSMNELPSTLLQQHESESSSDPPTPVVTPDSPTPVVDSSFPAPPTEEDLHKIVSLPCAHVFHASCLIPWFSRPRQTTCPTCRFNIDPENLTYIPRPRQSQQPGAPPPPFFDGVPGVPAPAPAPAPTADAPENTPIGNATPAGAGAPPNATPNAIPGVPQGGARGAPAGFAAMFGNINNTPIQFMPVPIGQPGNGVGGADFAAMFDNMLRARAAGQQGTPPGPQQQHQPQQHQPPQFFMGGPPPGFNPAPGQGDPNTIFTVDFTLFTNSPFEGNGVRRQTHVFANQIFGENGARDPGPPPDLPPAFTFGGPPPQQPQAETGQGAPTGLPQQPPPPFTFGGQLPQQGPFPTHQTPRPSQPREKKQWTLPTAPGPTLRSRVEEREREVGLRCCDTSCGVGPSDEDPFPDVSGSSMKQLSIRPLPNSLVMSTSVCSHTFHPACLVSAERVAGWGGEDKKEDQVEVSCPNCRAVGCVSREEWEEGASGLA